MPDPGISSDHLWRLLATAPARRATARARRAGAIRMACVLEATAPKVGNVHPAAHFHDLTYSHFVAAADAVAEVLSELDGADQVGAGIRSAVAASGVATGTNVNLGIVLLLAPLLACEPTWHRDRTASLEQRCSTLEQRRSTLEQRCSTWQCRVAELLDRLDHRQGALIAGAISAANAGGLSEESLGEDHPLDVTGKLTDSYDIVAAMRLAASRDRIALQYADGYRDLFEHVVPTLGQWVASTGDLLSGIVWAHIALIAEAGDSLIGRKCGQAESDRVARLARACLRVKRDEPQQDPIASVRHLDTALRADGNRLNPGTTADLIAAAIYVLLRCNTIPSVRPG